MRVLLIGASGQLGTALESVFADASELLTTACYHPQARHVPLDLGDEAAVRMLMDRWRPDLTLVAGAMCRVDRCETEGDLCRAINVGGPRIVAEAARQQGSRVVFFSTDHIFDGTQDSYSEDDEARPLSVYARSKRDAEAAIRDIVPERHLIVRTGWVYGPDRQRRNFIFQLIDRVRAGELVEVPSDQWGSPTHAEDLARAVRFLVERDATGTFHATGPDFVDRASLARRVCDTFALDANRIVPVPTAALGQIAQRSLRVLLDCSRLHATGAPAFRGISAGLEALASQPLPQWQGAS